MYVSPSSPELHVTNTSIIAGIITMIVNSVSVVALMLFNVDKRHDGHFDYHVWSVILLSFITVSNVFLLFLLRGCELFCVIVPRFPGRRLSDFY